ncbi:hypothetical protein BDF21DRAFT_403908 [Thamnidium elegans]|nr:hypothetical protein BDF21DRAFT_403908 [Thamnidium elegans]
MSKYENLKRLYFIVDNVTLFIPTDEQFRARCQKLRDTDKLEASSIWTFLLSILARVYFSANEAANNNELQAQARRLKKSKVTVESSAIFSTGLKILRKEYYRFIEKDMFSKNLLILLGGCQVRLPRLVFGTQYTTVGRPVSSHTRSPYIP